MEDGRQGHILASQERDYNILECKRLSIPWLSSRNCWVTHLITLRGSVSGCRNYFYIFWKASLHGKWQSKAGVTQLHWTGNCGALFTLLRWTDSRKRQKKFLRMLKFAFVNMYFFLSPEIFWVCCHPHLLAKVRCQQASGTIYLPTCSTDTDVQHWWLVLSHRGKFTPEFTIF